MINCESNLPGLLYVQKEDITATPSYIV